MSQAFAENVFFCQCSISGKWHSISKKNFIKSKLGYPNLTLMPPITGDSLQFSLTEGSTP